VLHTGLVVDRVALASVLGDVGVHEVDDVGPDSGGEDCGEDEVGSSALNDGLALGAGGIVDVDNLSVDHGDKYYIKLIKYPFINIDPLTNSTPRKITLLSLGWLASKE
jgi:hypothetical protein